MTEKPSVPIDGSHFAGILVTWNLCPRCNHLVDADDVHDGSEVYCHGCEIPLVCVAFEDGSWALTEYDNEDKIGGDDDDR